MENLKMSIVEARREVKALIQILNASINWEFDEEKMAKSFKNYYNNSKGTKEERRENATWLINYYSHLYRRTQTLNI